MIAALIFAASLALVQQQAAAPPYTAQCLQQIAGLTHSRFDILDPQHIEATTRKADALALRGVQLIAAQESLARAYADGIDLALRQEDSGEMPSGSGRMLQDERRAQMAEIERTKSEFERSTSECVWPWQGGTTSPENISTPVWDVGPTTTFPERARSRGVSSGSVTLRCSFEPHGPATDCEVLSETPSGNGFAQAAIAGSRRAKLAPESFAGAVVPASATFTLHFAE